MNGTPHSFLPDRLAYADGDIDDPALHLDMGQMFPRTPRQRAAIRALLPDGHAPTLARSIFGPSLEWAYCACDLARLPDLGAGPHRRPVADTRQICLFNLIVATEWRPSAAYLGQLERGLRQASDCLYEATGGRMAFGQALIGGPEWLGCADIQIMASNRLRPRVWVSGLHENKKYMPIRCGRGLWSEDGRTTIAWDEPEAYRTLVHEWAHYALELRDDCLALCDGSLACAPGQEPAADTCSLLIPTINLAHESIIDTLEETSELVPCGAATSRKRQEQAWELIRRNGRFPFLGEAVPRGPLDAPERLPLPHIGHLGALADAEGQELLVPIPAELADVPCWAYLIHGPPDRPVRVVAQGTLDARAHAQGFPMLGAQAGCTVVLVAAHLWGSAVYRAVIDGAAPRGGDMVAQISGWICATPPLPTVDVLPCPVDPQADVQVGAVRLRVASRAGQPQPAAIWVAPQGLGDTCAPIALGRSDAQEWCSPPLAVPTLDGHVLMRWDDGALAISSFSQGSGPQTHIPSPPSVTTGGSSDGTLMLFFSNPHDGRNHSLNRIVTTVVHDAPERLASGALAQGYAFSVAGNMPLDRALTPTLVIHFDHTAPAADGDLLIHRYDARADAWRPIPTYVPPGARYAAAPLDPTTAPQLTSALDGGPRAERYRLYCVPRP